MKELDQLQWQLGEAPWLAVFNPANNSMVTAKENASLLSQLLYVHSGGHRADRPLREHESNTRI